MGQAVSETRSSSAFALSLVGGILIIFGSILIGLLFSYFQMWMNGMMGGGMMGGMMGTMMTGGFFGISLIAGIFGDSRSSNDEYTTTRNYPLGHSCSGIFGDRIYRNGSFDNWCYHWNYWWCDGNK